MNFKDIHFSWFYIGTVAAFVFCSVLVRMELNGQFSSPIEERGYCIVVYPDTSEFAKEVDLNSMNDSARTSISLGKELFNGNCKQCHAINAKVVGPPLKDVMIRRTEDWLIKFIKFPQKTIERGDKYAVALYNQYNQFMPNHDFLKDEEIKAILSFIEFESQYVY